MPIRPMMPHRSRAPSRHKGQTLAATALVIWFNWQIGAPRQAIPDRLRSLNCQDSPVNDLAAAAVRAGDDLQPVTVGVVEVQAAAAVVVVDRPGPALDGIRPVRQPPVPAAAEGGAELVLAHEA